MKQSKTTKKVRKKREERYPDARGLDEIISPLTLKIKKGSWELFKNLTPRNKKLNDAVVGLIEKHIYDNSKDASDEEVEKWFKDQEYYENKERKRKNE